MGAEFVPMINGANQAGAMLQDIELYRAEWSRANVHYLMGYNEPDPNPLHPQSVEAAIAAVDWVDVQRFAAAFNPPLILVSPAPAGKDFNDDGRSKWLVKYRRS